MNKIMNSNNAQSTHSSGASAPQVLDRAATKAVRVNISMPHMLRNVAEQVVVARGYSGLSDYFQSHLRSDAAHLGIEPFSLPGPDMARLTYVPRQEPEMTCGLAG